MNNPTNSEIDQDRAADLWDLWTRTGHVMFPQNRRIYEHLSRVLRGRRVLEAGCGAGVGSAMLAQSALLFQATDKLRANVAFARELYPWVHFGLWDLNSPWHGGQADVAVCVDAVEHVSDPGRAIRHLLGAARREVYFSTPNGEGRKMPPENPFHTREFTRAEVLALLGGRDVTVLDWETFTEPVAETNTFVYWVRL